MKSKSNALLKNVDEPLNPSLSDETSLKSSPKNPVNLYLFLTEN